MNALAIFARRSLSTKLILLVVLFVFIAEFVVLVPSISNQRLDWLNARIEEAYLVTVALEGAQEAMIDDEVLRQLFETANIQGVTVNYGKMHKLILAPQLDPHGPPTMLSVNLDDHSPSSMISNAWATMFSKGDNLIQVAGTPRYVEDQVVNIIVSQRALRQDLHLYARNILGLSLVISTLTALLVYGALNLIIVRPVKRLTNDMAAFESDPDREALIHAPSNRLDEIGAAERSLEAMQRRTHELLNERRRLAAVGAGISKISHDLRNILASAQLMSDRLAKSEDPRVRKLSPRLISALDRAIALSRDTLAFGGMEPRRLNRTPFPLRELVDEIFDDTAAMGIEAKNLVPEDLTVDADRTQLYRSLFNLVRNAVEAMAPRAGENAEGTSPDATVGAVAVSAEQAGARIAILVTDTGPGIPPHAMPELFEPFKGSQKPGGSGLGVAIAAEIIRAHGGELSLVRTGSEGTEFKAALPAPAAKKP